MINRPNVRISALAAALVLSAASAWAMHELRDSSLVPSWKVAEPTPGARADAQPTPPAEPVVATETATATTTTTTMTPGERIAQPDAVATPAPALPREPAIAVEVPRLTVDQRIQADVMDALARMPNVSGKIGVVSEDSVVTLTGYTTTSGQAMRAGREAGRVEGVRYVVNEIRPRIGAITS